jgi:hypothetical protein
VSARQPENLQVGLRNVFTGVGVPKVTSTRLSR